MAQMQAQGSLNIQLGVCSEVLEAFEHYLAWGYGWRGSLPVMAIWLAYL